MPVILPTSKLVPTRINPKILVLYSLPKVGKTSELSKLNSCLLLDLENGADMYEALRVPITSIKKLDETIAAIIEYGVANGGKYPYTYIAIDTADMLEDFCVVSSTKKYKASIIGKNFEGDSVLELPKGLGYYYLRNEVLLKIEQLALVCKFLIITAHVKDKTLESKGGVEVTTRDISLSGKLAGMVCAKADAIGYMYRDGDKLMVNFETNEGAIMGSRFPHLAGKTFEFDWSKIYLKEETKAA